MADELRSRLTGARPSPSVLDTTGRTGGAHGGGPIVRGDELEVRDGSAAAASDAVTVRRPHDAVVLVIGAGDMARFRRGVVSDVAKLVHADNDRVIEALKGGQEEIVAALATQNLAYKESLAKQTSALTALRNDLSSQLDEANTKLDRANQKLLDVEHALGGARAEVLATRAEAAAEALAAKARHDEAIGFARKEVEDATARHAAITEQLAGAERRLTETTKRLAAENKLAVDGLTSEIQRLEREINVDGISHEAKNSIIVTLFAYAALRTLLLGTGPAAVFSGVIGAGYTAYQIYNRFMGSIGQKQKTE